MNRAENIPTTITAGIFIRNERIGSVGVKELYSEVTENQFALLEHVAGRLSIVMSKDNYSSYVQTSYVNRFIIDIINGISFDEHLIQYYLSKHGWKIDDDYYLIKIIPNQKDIESGTLRYSVELIKNIFPESVPLVIHDLLAVVINASKCKDTLGESFHLLEDLLNKRDFLGGVSLCFNDFMELGEQYKLVSSIIEVGKLLDEKKRLFYHEKYAISHIISLCNQLINLRLLCHREAIRLYEHDKKSKK